MLKQMLSLIPPLAISLSVLAPPTPALAQGAAKSNQEWWPEQLNLKLLRQNDAASSPMDKTFNYARAFESLDLNAVKQDLKKLMTTSQDWWPADYGHYGPLFIRMAWHSAGTYRTSDGRGGADGGMQRFAPLNSWPDNANLDKAQRLLWPLKQKYGQKISWADLMILSGTVAMESMGFKTAGFAGGRTDGWQSEEVNWGPEDEWLADKRHHGKRELKQPLAAAQMGLIYVNPVGPNGVPDPLAAARDIREIFARMAMNDEETVALIAGGHTFGKAHGIADPARYLEAEPEGAGIEEQGLGWRNRYGEGNAGDTITSGLEGAWTSNPTAWTHIYFKHLFTYNWVQTKSPAGAIQWVPEEKSAAALVPDAHDPKKRHAPVMFTTDLALKADPDYRKISRRFLDNPQAFEQAFARAWFKLTHRDLGPRSRYLGSLVPDENYLWQDPVPANTYQPIDKADIKTLKARILASGLPATELIKTAWASASTFRGTDMRGGANGARIRLAPQKNWPVNQPAALANTLKQLEKIQHDFNGAQSGKKRVSLADLIILGGSSAIEQAAAKAGHQVEVPFSPGRTDASQAQTDVESFAVLEPAADGFRNYLGKNKQPPAQLLVEKAAQLTLTVPEMTVLVGGMRVLDANAGQSKHGVFTERPGSLSNDFFVNLLDMSTLWTKSPGSEHLYQGHDRTSGALKWTATSVDLIFGSNSELRAVAEVYAFDGSQEKFIRDFITAWTKVMNLDRYDLL
ncbi:catalase/peroxidase HPI [Thalassomonas viridans]|uniref:Catalase-peroxidase n=1 Tax=Thalassomonas viridans TaxID=137584 RepID=A0AAF0CBV8_9GAMM|nr:catalase/peroxidase HPI [Thalassomonas viridans]WDE06914.1 catalase/peroxidase HPI [Thalassomonas viridans]